MKTILNLGAPTHKEFFTADRRAGRRPPPGACAAMEPRATGTQRFVTGACFVATTVVVVCICFADPAADQKGKNANDRSGAFRSSATTESTQLVERLAPGAVITPSTAGVRASSADASNDFNQKTGNALSGVGVTNDYRVPAQPNLSPVPEPSVWAVLFMGFFFLVVRGKTFGSGNN